MRCKLLMTPSPLSSPVRARPPPQFLRFPGASSVHCACLPSPSPPRSSAVESSHTTFTPSRDLPQSSNPYPQPFLPRWASAAGAGALLALSLPLVRPSPSLARTAALHRMTSTAAASSPSALAFPSVPSLTELQALAGPPAVPLRLAHARERFQEEAAADEGVPEPEVVLFRDNSAWCPYCERVWLQLEEKRIPYRVEKINMRCYGPKPDWFLQMVPSGLLPVLQLDGRVVTESMDIMFLLEEAFPSHKPLLPADAAGRRRVDVLLRLERQLVGPWLQWARAPPLSRGGWFGPDPAGAFEQAILAVDAALAEGGGPYFMGSEFSLVDAVYAPFLERIAASVPFWKGLQVRGNPKWPHLNAWMDAMDSRPTYRAIKSDDFTITHTLEPQIGSVTKLPEGSAYRAKVEGKDSGWDLPLKPEDTAWGHDDGTGAGGAREEAAQALVSNHEAIVGFAMRGLALKPADAPAVASHVSAGLRHVAHALLKGHENVGPLPSGLDAPQTATAAAYLRDRVGVPRDLTYPAARQLRAHLQWLIRSLGSDL